MEGEQPVAQDLLADEPRCVGSSFAFRPAAHGSHRRSGRSQHRRVYLGFRSGNLIMAFAFRIDTWADDGESIVEHVADVDDLTIALATYHAACSGGPARPSPYGKARG